jgi:hypothetical protein
MGVDYAQNMDLPHFGEEQPGDIYYYSPLTVNVFGVTNLTAKPTKMMAYGYTEAEGGKGSNNVASLIVKALEDFGWLLPGQPGKQLSIVMDNCGGQNKNNNVLRLALYLVELKFFNKVELVFYVRGHTKNDCDRLFNQLKLRWHKMNTYTMEQMVDCLNTQPHVTFVEVKADIFKDYGTLFSSFYNQFPPGTIQKNHIFWVDSTNSTTMMMKISHDAQSTVRHNFKKNNNVSNDNRFRQLMAASLSAVTRPGIKPIKQVELYKKWRPFVPHQFRDQICPRPTDEVLEAVRNEKNSKARDRTARKKRGGRS